MITKLLDEYTWPELEQILKDHAFRFDQSEKYFWLQFKHSDTPDHSQMVQQVAMGLIYDRFYLGEKPSRKDAHIYSLKKALKIINGDESYFKQIREVFIKSISADSLAMSQKHYNDLEAGVRSEVKSLTMHELYLRARSFRTYENMGSHLGKNYIMHCITEQITKYFKDNKNL